MHLTGVLFKYDQESQKELEAIGNSTRFGVLVKRKFNVTISDSGQT